MSIFFSQIKDYFKNQTKEIDFIYNYNSNNYKDKTFRFERYDNQPQYNCFLSYFSNGTFNNDNSFELLIDTFKEDWLEEWKKNTYNLNKYRINIADKEFKDCYDELKNKFSYIKNNFSINYWKSNWKQILLQIKIDINDINKKNYISINNKEFEEIEKTVFQIMIIPSIKKYYDNSPDRYLEEYDQIFEWKRIPLNENYKIFGNKINCSNVEQGYLGTCYFLETISTLSNFGQLLYQLFPNEQINDNGLYEICLFHEGKWVKVLVDDYFVFFKNNNKFAFAKPVNNCLYSCFLEKAYAKLKGSYADINGSYNCQAFEALTGFRADEFPFRDRNNNRLIKDEIYNYCYKKHFEGYLFASCTKGHAYSILSISKENSENIFQIRNPWAYLPEENKKYFSEFLKKFPEYNINDVTGIFYLDQANFEDKFEKIAICQILFGSTIYNYKLDNNFLVDNKKMYFYFEIYKKSKIALGLLKKNNEGFFQKFEVKLLNIENNNINNLLTISDFKNEISKIIQNYNMHNYDNYNEIEKGKYLIIISFKNNISSNPNLDLNDKYLKIIIEGNINIKYLGFSITAPNINNPTENIEFTKYNYGLRTGELFKKYKNIIKIMKQEFNIKLHPDSKGFYIETIFNDEFETLVRFDKIKLTIQACCHEKSQDAYLIGNNHINGRIDDENGKMIKLINNESKIVYQGNIKENKLFICDKFELNQDLTEVFSKNVNSFIFNENSFIKSFMHKHELKYKSVQSDWTCDFCLREFDKDVESFGCRNCNFDLCKDCLFMNEKDFINKLSNLLVSKKITIQNSDINNYIIKCDFHNHNLKYIKLSQNQIKRCNLCKEQNKDVKLFFCNLCQYNICIQCLLNSNFSNDLNSNNFVKYIFNIGINDLNKEILLFRFRVNNKNEIFNITEIYYNDIKLNLLTNNNQDWSIKYNFGNPGKYEIKVIFKKSFPTMNSFFRKNLNLYSLDLSNFNTQYATTMYNMFTDCENLEYINLTNIKTSKVTDMQSMFFNCPKLKEIKGLNSLDTSKVNNMMAMFACCKELKNLNLSSFNTSNVNYIEGMFSGCYKLKEIEGLNNFNTSKIKNMYALFNCCLDLESLDLSNFDMSNVEINNYMFNKCKSLRQIKGEQNFIINNKIFTIIFPIKKDLYIFENTEVNFDGYDDRNDKKKNNEWPIPKLSILYGSRVNIIGGQIYLL